MSQETLNTVLSGIAAFTGLVAVGIAIHQILRHRSEREEDRRTAEEQRQRAEEQLRLARQQAEMRPDLEVSIDLRPYGSHSVVRETKFGMLAVEVHNSGKAAANSVHGWLYLEATNLSPYDRWAASVSTGRPILRPDILSNRSWGASCAEEQTPEDGYYQCQLWENDRILPGSYRTFEFPVRKLRQGDAEVRYRVVSSEGAEIEGSTMVEVSTGEGEGP